MTAPTKRQIDRVLSAIPQNWLDPLLTGPDKVLRGEFDRRDIQRLLNAVRERVRAALAARRR